MIVLTAHQFFAALCVRADREGVKPHSLAAEAKVTRSVFFEAKSGKPIAPETAEKLITLARKLISPDVIELIDGAGRHHIAADFVARATAKMAKQDAELAILRRAFLTRCRASSL